MNPRKCHQEAWKHFWPEGNGKAKHGYVLHHIDMEMKQNNPERYNEWRIEDLTMLTLKEHNLIHKKHETMRPYSDAAHRGSHHYYNVVTHEQQMFKDAPPSDDWEKGLLYCSDRREYAATQNRDSNGRFISGRKLISDLCIDLTKEKNGMFKKSMYESKDEKKLEEIRDKKRSTFYSKTKEEQDIINGRRGHGNPVICLTTR